MVKTPGLLWGYNKTCSFGLMRFDTTLPDPQVTFTAIAIDGRRVHTHKLLRSQLNSPAARRPLQEGQHEHGSCSENLT